MNMLDKTGTGKLRATLKREYALKPEGKMVQLGGLSSQNFRFKANHQMWVAKQFSHADPGHFEKLNEIFRTLKASSYPTPVPKQTLAGDLFHVDRTLAVGVLPFWAGHTLHHGSFAPVSVASAAQVIRRLHLLEVPVSLANTMATNTPARPSLKQFLRVKFSLLAQLKRSRSPEEAVIRRAIGEKEDFLQQMAKPDDVFSGKNVLVHGDCHNENFLFDGTGQALALLDFDLSRLGNPLEDVIKFIDFSFCINGVSSAGGDLARIFLDAYGCDRRIQAEEIRLAIHHHAEQTALSLHLEQLLLSGAKEVSCLIERDLIKLRAHRRGDDALLRELLAHH